MPDLCKKNKTKNKYVTLNKIMFYRRRKKPTNQQELLDGIQEFWDTVTPAVCCRYIDHLFQVVQKVVDVNGEASGY